MKLYKGTFSSLFLVGILEEEPIIYESICGKKSAEFFMTVYKAEADFDNTELPDQFFLYRVIAENSEAIKIKNHGMLGVQLFVEGELQNYHILSKGEKKLVVSEIKAKKLWFSHYSELNQLSEKPQAAFNYFTRNVISIDRSEYLH